MLFDDDDDHVATHVPVANEKSLSSLSYEEIVKDLILVENQYLRELNMIIKVFQDALEKIASVTEVVGFLHNRSLQSIGYSSQSINQSLAINNKSYYYYY